MSEADGTSKSPEQAPSKMVEGRHPYFLTHLNSPEMNLKITILMEPIMKIGEEGY